GVRLPATRIAPVASTGSGTRTYQWEKLGASGVWASVADVAGVRTGTTTPNMCVTRARSEDLGLYRCQVTNSCNQTVSSNPAELALSGYPCGGLVGLWTFDGCNFQDSSGQGNHGVAQGGPTCVPGISDAAFSLDSVDDEVRVPNSPSLNPVNGLTVAAWVQPRNHGGGNLAIVSKGDGATFGPPYYQYHLGITGNVPGSEYLFSWDVQTDQGTFQISSPRFSWDPVDVPGNQREWYFVVGTYDGAEMALYVIKDGGTVVHVERRALTGVMHDSGQDLYFGRYSNAAQPRAPFSLDEVRLYNSALSADDIFFLHASPSGRPKASRVGGGLGERAELIASRISAGCESFQWRLDGVPLQNVPGHISGVNSPVLIVENVSLADDGEYDVLVTNSCGSRVSTPAYLPYCVADLDQDGDVDGDDIIVFFGYWDGSDIRADLNQDGGVDSDDTIVFFQRFESNC
ncbi:MAG: LamG-like jellyroll fold domain-containing protein, partial [Phycisphaerales bacterium]